MSGDPYKRRLVTDNAYQCGCCWVRQRHGDVLVECALHAAASLARFELAQRRRKR